MHDLLLKTFEQFVTLSESEKLLFTKLFKPLSIKKGDYFLKEGTKNNRLGFLTKGLVYYTVLKKDEESITEFTKEGEFVSEYHTFINQSNAIHSIKAIEDCEFLVINYEGLQRIFNDTPNGNKIGRLVLEYRFGIMINQLLSLYKHNPEQRYLNFVKTYADLAQRIPQYLIASYIGVKPPSLSRIRNRVAKSLS
jgi:CRP-like cAMP-binding protein